MAGRVATRVCVVGAGRNSDQRQAGPSAGPSPAPGRHGLVSPKKGWVLRKRLCWRVPPPRLSLLGKSSGSSWAQLQLGRNHRGFEARPTVTVQSDALACHLGVVTAPFGRPRASIRPRAVQGCLAPRLPSRQDAASVSLTQPFRLDRTYAPANADQGTRRIALRDNALAAVR